MSHDIDAIYDHCVFRPLEPLVLPEGTEVHLRVEEKKRNRRESENGPESNNVGRICGPRLAHPQ